MFLAAIHDRPDVEQPSDAALMDRLARKDSSALEALYDRYSRPVYSLVLRIGQQAATAEEIVQDIFLQLWRNAHLYQSSRGRLEPWLFTMARNRALDHLRLKMEKQRRREDSIDLHPPAFVAPNPETLFDRKRRAEKVRAMIQSLPDQQQRAIQLAFFEGLTHSEIAQVLREPLGTVKSWIRGGLLRLREALEEAS